jgi:hypothetical protein
MMVGMMTMAGEMKQILVKLKQKKVNKFQRRNKKRSKSIKLPPKLMKKKLKKIFILPKMMTSRKKTNSTKFCQQAKKMVVF